MSERSGLSSEAMAALGLNPAAIERHQALLVDAVRRQRKPQVEIIDTCRLDNGGLLPEAKGAATGPAGAGYVAFVPAAGAASRYSQPLFALTTALEDGNYSALAERLAALAAEGAARWPLPPRVTRLMAHPDAARDLPEAEAHALLHDLQLPKALMPCVREGLTFLTMKDREHQRLGGFVGQVFVTPPGQEPMFQETLAAGRKAWPAPEPGPPAPTAFVAQGPELSTIRFRPDGTPVVEADGRLSPVPAGHGALAQLFPEVGRRFPEAQSLFIRNIDNVMGTGNAAAAATAAFLDTHRQLLACVRRIRTSLAAGKVEDAAAAELMAFAGPATRHAGGALPDGALAALPPAERRLWEAQLRLFHARPDGPLTLDRLRRLYERPVTLLGQVPNTGKDVGGTPCFIRTGGGVDKVCVEVPHASEADLQTFLADPAKATHFNPVFVAAEITIDPDYYAARAGDFWLKSEKTYRGQRVMYFETVLYELLGNSALANCAFIAVPRFVFHPHKTLQDALGRSADSWLRPKDP